VNYSKKTIQEIISKYEIFHIPYYQREYVWEGKNNKDSRTTYNKFITDISDECFKNPNVKYFIGNLSFNKISVSEVVDGQQRITTLVLFLCILADNFCSPYIKTLNSTKVYDNKTNEFIIQEEHYLTEELEGSLGYKAYNGTAEKIGIDRVISNTVSLINRYYGTKNNTDFDVLYKYILNNVEAIILEYNNSKDALRYFLNINSFSIVLTPNEIFFTILSQSLKISKNSQTIYDVKQSIKSIENTFEKININNIISIFIEAYYQADKDIKDLQTLDVGKWMSYYKTDVYSHIPTANDFCVNFLQYLSDLNEILSYYHWKTTPRNFNSPIYLTHSLLKYENYNDLVKLLKILLINRHNYRTNFLYEPNTHVLSQDLMEDLSKRINFTLFNDYFRSSSKRLDLLKTNIEIDGNGSPKLSLNDILTNTQMSINSIFSLTYMKDPQSNPKLKLKDESTIIKVIFALQQGFLSYTADNTNAYYNYINDCLSQGKFTIEHLVSKTEFTDLNRRNNWVNIKNKFINANDFDNERSLFENLTLLNTKSNSSANDSEIYDKFDKYKKAHEILNFGEEFLVQSLVDGSNYYNNSNILNLNLPDRRITTIRQNTWEHSTNNRKFNSELLQKALKALL
jgi:hypothetical protein